MRNSHTRLLSVREQTEACCRRYAHLSLGKYSVLRELDFVRQAWTARPQLKYLYLGYYIPDNEKMTYKVCFSSLASACTRWCGRKQLPRSMLHFV